MPDDTLKPETPKRRKSRKSGTVRATVVARKILGDSNRKIARDLGINRETVGRIIDDSEYREIVKSHRQEILDLIPKAIRAYRETLDGLDTPAYLKPDAKPIEVLDGGELKKRLEEAYRAGLSKGLDVVRVAGDVLRGTQALTSKEEVAVSVEQQARSLTPEERKAEIEALLAVVKAKK